MLSSKPKRWIARFVARFVQLPRVILYSLLSNNRFHGKPHRLQPAQLVGMGTIIFEENVKIGVFPSPLFFSTYAYIEARHSSAVIKIGSCTWINNDFSAIAEHTSITIGKNCLIGARVEILDSDFHGIKVEERNISAPQRARPVAIGNNVFVGSNVKIMKGVSIGSGSVIANGSVVTRDVPTGVLVGGNPASVLKVIEH